MTPALEPVRAVALLGALLAVALAIVALVAGQRAARQRRAAAQLLERRLELALDAGGMATWLWNAATDELNWDERAEHVYGGPPPASQMAWLRRVHPEDRPELQTVLEQHVREHRRFQVVHRLEGRNGDDPVTETRWLELRGEPVLDGGGEILGTAGVVVDVTESRLASTELEASREAFEKILQLSPAFAAEDRPADVPARVCEAAVEVFRCQDASIWSFRGRTARRIASCPPGTAIPAAARVDPDRVPRLLGALAQGQPVYLSSADDMDPEVRAAMADAGLQAGLFVPLGVAFDELFLTMWWQEERDRPELGQLAVIRSFADQAELALALARTRVARDEVDTLNRTLQAGLLPAPSVRDAGVRVDARYQPGEHRLLLGGDFFDVVEWTDGGIAFVIGDVTGHGPGPAAIGAALRSSWRAAAYSGDDPARWLHDLGALLATYETGPELFVTVFTGRLEPGRESMVVAGAGHPPPILIVEGKAEPLDVPSGVALGLGAPGLGVTSTRIPVGPGTRLLLYTDGVTEVRAGRRSSDRLGTEGLVEWLEDRGATLPGGALLDALLRHIERINAEPLQDDAAAVLLEVSAPPV